MQLQRQLLYVYTCLYIKRSDVLMFNPLVCLIQHTKNNLLLSIEFAYSLTHIGGLKEPLLTYHVDFSGPLPFADKKYRYIFVIVDSLTRYCWLYGTPFPSAAEAIASLEKNYRNFGHPRQILYHRHSYALDSIELKNYCTRNGIEYIRLPRETLQGYGTVRTRFEWITSLVFVDVDTQCQQNWRTRLRSIEKIVNKSADADVIDNIGKNYAKTKCGE